MSSGKKGDGPLAVVSVMDRLKQLYFEKIRPLEEAYAFGEFYSCVARAPPDSLRLPRRTPSLPPRLRGRRRLAPLLLTTSRPMYKASDIDAKPMVLL